ncbi:DUF4376 domain-containing protein [Salmonella enterica]|nr:DUF4376 domain-containing protein [Salmonella enterica]EHQ7007690.1 DUF4376 domain-containing protein [Salmonella enterica subsp. houtenae serovar 50:z4,z23:-]HCZ1711930.1 DUF4376 domain-containing protein [Salmonella enterica subsp. enterica serovar Montevideo str. 0269]EFT3399761.1 DUF4376 domain-containing protein [Salmonella enterica]EFT3772074.1 DUF4376 domain-containing protein [Salmonella enterica]
MITITDARNGQYNENGTISVEVRFSDSDKYLPYTAAARDPADYGQQLYTDLVAGKYGYVAPFITTPEILQAAKARKRDEIKAWRDAQENGNIIFTLKGQRWDCGKASQARLAPVVAVAKAGLLPPGFFWTDADNTDVPMATGELVELEKAMQQNMVLQGFKIHERQRQMKEAVSALGSLGEVRSYRVGW